MKALDRFLQKWRIAKARPYVAAGSRVLDIGCADGALFDQLADRIAAGVGIDPDLKEPVCRGTVRLMPGRFPDHLPALEPFDAVTMLAVLEHFPQDQLAPVARACALALKPGGLLIITVPSPAVDRILHALQRLRLLDGMDVHQHTGFDVRATPALFLAAGLLLVKASTFQLGLNHLFVFQRPAS